jgi:signal peptidase I
MPEQPQETVPEERKESWLDTFRAVFWAALIALTIRSFVVEPFKIPSGSMIPTLLVGDFVLVNKFAYGLRLPITGTLIWDLDEPQRGDVIVFRYPDDPSEDFIKRIVGMPGDRVEMRDDRVWLNGQLVDRIPDGSFEYTNQEQLRVQTRRFTERNPEGVEYTIIRARPRDLAGRGGEWVVPEGSYFMMGDNRDNSSDSRRWKNRFVRADQIKGRAFGIHWSWVVEPGRQKSRGLILDLLNTVWRIVTFQIEEVRWDRIGRSLDGLADTTRPVSD